MKNQIHIILGKAWPSILGLLLSIIILCIIPSLYRKGPEGGWIWRIWASWVTQAMAMINVLSILGISICSRYGIEKAGTILIRIQILIFGLTVAFSGYLLWLNRG